MHPLTLSCHPGIAAIYYALYHSGYGFHAFDRPDEHVQSIESHAGKASVPAFFSRVRQTACEVYPFWPRAAILETAACYLREDCSGYGDEAAFRAHILAAPNIDDSERGPLLWEWLTGFPEALHTVLSSTEFQQYFAWVKAWTEAQRLRFQHELTRLRELFHICARHYSSSVEEIQIIIDPIKCVYSADYHLIGSRFLFCSGRMQTDSVLHEYLHHVIHPLLPAVRPLVLACHRAYPGLDPSYYLSGDAIGHLNAFEEHAVRTLTRDLIAQRPPDDLALYLHRLLSVPREGVIHE